MTNSAVPDQTAPSGSALFVIETMSLREVGSQLKIPINVTKGSMPCYTYA